MYSFAEQTDMLLVLGFCQGNCRESVRVYSERYPNRQIPNHQTFASVERRLRERGTFSKNASNCGRQRTVRTAEAEELILERVTEDPKISCRRLGLELGLSKDVVNRVLREQLLHPFHVQRVQDLLPFDPETRLAFCQTIQERRIQNNNFTHCILFTDEACFTRSGITNLHNEHVYADENPHAIKVSHYQHEFRINVWGGIIGSYLIGPVAMPDRLNGDNYLEFLRQTLPGLLEDLPLQLREDMWFMHDGAPPHFTLEVRQHLHENYEDRWIGRGNDASIAWPARSPDITPCDYFLWGALKSKVYASPVNTREELWGRIQNAANPIRNNEEMMQRTQFNLKEIEFVYR